jgi:hypothetical protein
LVYTTTPKASIVLENLQAEAGIESLRAMRAARQVEFRLCDVSRTLTPAGADAVARFVTRFDALAAPHSHTAGVTGAPPSAAGAQ